MANNTTEWVARYYERFYVGFSSGIMLALLLQRGCDLLKVLPHVAMETNKIVHRPTRNYFVHRQVCHTSTKTRQQYEAMERTPCYCFAIEPIVLLKNESRFSFLKTKNHSKFTTLQKKYIVSIINKYKLLSSIFYLNN